MMWVNSDEADATSVQSHTLRALTNPLSRAQSLIQFQPHQHAAQYLIKIP